MYTRLQLDLMFLCRPMMILVQKLSLVPFAVHDGELSVACITCCCSPTITSCVSGMGGNSRPLNKDQEKQKLT